MTAAAPIRQAEGELLLPEPLGLQPIWLDSPAPRKVLRVGRRGAKTRFAFFASLMGHGPGWETDTPTFKGVLQGGDVIWISPTYTNLSTVLWREEIIPRMQHLPWVNLNITLHNVDIAGLGSLMLRSGDAEAIESVRGAGKRLLGVIIDEAAWMALRSALLDVILPALLDNDGWLIIMSTTNAGSDGGYDDQGAPQIPSYFNQMCQEIQDGKRDPRMWEEFYGTAFDNPTLSHEAINELIAEYPPGSPKLDQEVYAKLLTSGIGLALPGIGHPRYVVPAFSPPKHWNQWASLDWAYHHLWVLCHYTVDEDGQVYQRDTLFGRLDLPEQIDQKVRVGGIDPSKLNIHTGPDAWRVRVSEKGKIKGEFTGPTVAEQLQALGWKLIPAADARVAGLNNIRRYTFIPPERPDAISRFLWMDTPGNLACQAQWAKMSIDPKNVEDALKVDADSAGRGGDDMYDSGRYGLMARPLPAEVPVPEEREGVSLGYDYENHRPRVRLTADQEVEKLFNRGGKVTPLAGRYSGPPRR